jgi:hypothetical protein
MDGKQSLYLILLLLAALVFGPVMVLTQDHAADAKALRPLTQQERIVDAPAPLPGTHAPLPDAGRCALSLLHR